MGVARHAATELWSHWRLRSVFKKIGNESESVEKRRPGPLFRKIGNHVRTPWKPEVVGGWEGGGAGQVLRGQVKER